MVVFFDCLQGISTKLMGEIKEVQGSGTSTMSPFFLQRGSVPRLGRYVVALFNEVPQYLNNCNANVLN